MMKLEKSSGEKSEDFLFTFALIALPSVVEANHKL